MSTPTLSARELGDRYGKSAAWVNAQCNAKTWPHLRVGKSYRFTDDHVAAIDALLTVPATPRTPAPAALPAAGAGNAWGRKGRGST